MHETLSINICSQVFQNSDGESIEINQTPYVMRCAIWYHLCNLKNVKNTHGGVLLLVKLQALKVTLLHGCFSCSLNCTYGTKSRKASHIILNSTQKCFKQNEL